MDDLAADVAALLEVGIVVAFVLLATVALVRAPRSGPSGWWVAAAFGALAASLSVVWVPDWMGRELPEWADSAGLLGVLAFPYLLLRFTASFRALPRALELAAAGGAVAAAVLAVVPSPGSRTPFLLVVVGYWAGVSGVTVARLWRAGGGQPGVARRRMRLMAGAAAVLVVALVTAIQAGDAPVTELISYGFALASALGFGLGFVPPRPLRLAWRRDEDLALQGATVALLRADTVDQVADDLLSPAMQILGASGAALVDEDGRVVARHGQAPQAGARVESAGDAGVDDNRVAAALGQGHGQLVVWTGPYTPFFGPEERGLFQSMAAIAALALQRCALLTDERGQRAALEQARQQAEAARHDAEVARAEADAANQAKSEFLSRMSHELRTPLNAVLGFGQLLEISTLGEEDQEAVGHILKAGRHLLALIDDVLDLSRIEAGMLTISLEPVHAGELIRDSISLIQPLATSRSIQITTDVDGCNDYVLTDRQRGRQVLLNLLSNAVKYNRDHGSVQVGCSRIDEMLRIAVRDTGPGIDPARRDRLFQPFERLGAESSGVEGTGLGLALTRQLVERLGGAIGLDTAPAAGSTFWIDLPITAAPTQPDDTDLTTDAGPVAGDRQLLLVEDNLDNLRLVEAMLRRRPGISVLPAMQGKLALELAYQHQPDIVVLDLHLPDMSGRDVLTRLKADPRTRDIPVVIASADATPRRIRQLHADGALDYITKPLDLHRFLQAIDAALATHHDPA